MFKFWDNHGVLGINARNLLYIKPYNPKSGIRFADDKLKTKQFLSARGIKVPKMIAKISTEHDLKMFSFSALPGSFVLKPNSGFGGEGIIVTTKREDLGWSDTGGTLVTVEDLFEHSADILDGKYSITGSKDVAFFEQRLIPHTALGLMGKYGLPDIRVIVYNMVPVMAMVRVPTAISEGKANMEQGGLGAGIDLAKGEITHIAQYNGLLKTGSEWDSIRGLKIPMWEEVLLTATRIQSMVTLGYLAVDIVIDQQNGPTLLEINARAGLKVQVANLAPLRDRLDRVSGVKVKTPEKGVRMAQDLFGNKIERKIEHLSGKRIIGLEETITFNLKHGTKELLAKVNPSTQKNYLDRELFEVISMAKEKGEKMTKMTLNYSLGGVRGKSIFYPLNMKRSEHKVLLGSTMLKGFLVDINHHKEPFALPSREKSKEKVNPTVGDSVVDPRKADAQLAEMDRQIALVSALRPVNLAEEYKRFFASDTAEPRFRYREVRIPVEDLRTQLLSMRLDESALGKLLDMKRLELLLKLDTIEAIGNDAVFPRSSLTLFGEVPEPILMEAKERAKGLVSGAKPVLDKTDEETAAYFRTVLDRHNLSFWEVKLKEGIVSRCVIGKHHRLFIRKGERFSQGDLEKLAVHEIETHIFCTENGKLQPYQLFQRGLGNSLKTQEGLAVYNQHVVTGDANVTAVLGLLATEKAKTLGFRALFDWLHVTVDREEAWKMAVKVKRGMTDTGRPGGFTKNALYFWGWMEVERYVAGGGDLKKLYLGKVALEQMDLVDRLEGLVEPRWIRTMENAQKKIFFSH